MVLPRQAAPLDRGWKPGNDEPHDRIEARDYKMGVALQGCGGGCVGDSWVYVCTVKGKVVRKVQIDGLCGKLV